MSESTLRIVEIFRSIQGEGTRAGRPCTLVRLAGCNLRCAWCDTPYAWSDGREISIDEVLVEVRRRGGTLVELTGGEPLHQDASIELLRRLCDAGYETLLETNGSQDIGPVDERVARIVDFKCPSSGMAGHNRWENAELLRPDDEVKFVIATREDYEFARDACIQQGLPRRCSVLFSPATPGVNASALAEWILADALDVRLNLQLHKVIWPGEGRGR
jgi:7-carboxy-7-deazaguanine synthase